MAVARRSGSGMVVVLVISIVIACIAIGLSLWLAKQISTTNQAIMANQKDFADSVAKIFDSQKQNGWAMPPNPSDKLGFKYGGTSYSAVKDKLNEAISYERVMTALGWEGPDIVEKALTDSVAQNDLPDKFKTMKNLLGYYEQQYTDLRKRVGDLETTVDSQRSQLAAKTEELNKATDELSKRAVAAENQRAEDLKSLTTQFNEIKKMYDASRDKIKEGEANLDKAKADWEAKLAETQKESAGWKELYEKSKVGEPVEPKMTPAGRVLEVDLGYGFVIVEGGENVNRETNVEFVVYTQTPAGVRTKKADLLTTRIFKNTAQALVVEKTDMILPGDLIVGKDVWKKFNPAAAAVAPVAAAPAVPAKEAPKPAAPTVPAPTAPATPTPAPAPTSAPAGATPAPAPAGGM